MQKRSNRLALRVLSTATFLAMVSSCTTAAFADTYDLTEGSVTVRAESSGTYVTQTDSDNNYVKNDYGDLLKDYRDDTPTLTTEGKEEKNNTASIYTEKGVSTTVTLDNVNINASDTGKAAIYTEGKVTLELDGNNTLTGGTNHAALEKRSGVSNDAPDENYTLTLQDKTGKTGSLTATGGAGGAGIGGGSVQTTDGYANNITITGGTVTATGGEGAAGIGGGKGSNKNGGNGDSITISGENTTVTATGGAGGAGIGGGKGDGGYRSGQGIYITVEDGAHVEATGGAGGAGIGGGAGSAGGESSGLGSNITITGEGTTVNANGNAGGAGIGGGAGGAGSGSGQGFTITVEDGAHVEATGGAGGAGIGGGDGSKGGDVSGLGRDITITGEGTTVTATGGTAGSGIGGGQNSQGYIVDISGGAQVDATGGAEGGAGIGGGKKTGNHVYAGSGNTITISGEKTQVTANGNDGGAGIGGGSGGYGAKITVNDGTVTANGSGGGAGIGSGDASNADPAQVRGYRIQISGGTVTANGGADGGAGIGGGKGTAASLKNGGNGVTITDGTVTATGGKGAAGIGSGADSRWALGSFVDITGGTVTATGGAGEAAGIGNGENDAGTSTVKISATNAALDVTAVTQGSGEAITGENGVTMASLTNDFSGVVRFFRSKNHYNTVHNGKYVGMNDNNADEHKKTDAHIWDSAKDEILQQATPAVRGIVRHHCEVDGCKGYYDEPFDYVAPAEPVTPAPTDPDTPDVAPGAPAQDTPDVPGTSDVAPGAPAQGTPDVPDTLDVTPDAPADAVAGAAAAKEVSVTPSRAQSVIAAALPQTGVNWLIAAVGSALGGMFLLAVGFVLNHKSRGQN